MSLKEDLAKGNKHIDKVLCILTEFFSPKGVKNVEIASVYEDQKHNTDVFVYLAQGNPLRIAVRTRSYKKRSSDFTFRSKAKGGNTYVEWQKMKDGLGDYMFYATESKSGATIDAYTLIDLDLVREFTECSPLAPTKSNIFNPDGSEGVSYNMHHVLEYDPRTFAFQVDENNPAAATNMYKFITQRR